MKVNWLFKNVTVIDGSGGPQYRGDVAVKGDRIVIQNNKGNKWQEEYSQPH